MSVFIPIPITELETAPASPTRTYKLDLENGRIFSAGSIDGLDAVTQFIKKAIITPRFRCMIYDDQYGSEIKQAVFTGSVTPEYVETEIPGYVKDAIMFDGRVLSVSGFSIEFDNENAYIQCRVLTTYGETLIEEVI